MTRMTSSRIAGSTFLLYIALGITTMVLSGRATGGEGAAARLMWLPMAAFEIPLALWLLVRGAASPARPQ